jgi:hypothetical protein
MKSHPVLNVQRIIIRFRLRFLISNIVVNWYLRLINAVASKGLTFVMRDLGCDEMDVCTLEKRASNEDNFITELLPNLGKAFDRSLSMGYMLPVDQFEQDDSGRPLFLGPQFRGVFGDDGQLLDDAPAGLVRTIRQVCFYAYKLDLPYESAKNKRVIDNFKRTEEELQEPQNLPSENVGDPFHMWTDELNRKIPTDPQSFLASALVQQVFLDYQPKNLKPKHGPGVTANVSTHQKWSAKLSDGCPVGDLASLYWFNEHDAFSRLNRFPTWESTSLFRVNQNAIAKVILVPKDSRGPRLISAEPAERMFLQQGIKNEMVEMLQRHTLTAGHVNFDDQTVNREKALESSKTRFWATIDLKDASDRVSVDLVNLLFGETLLRQHMMLVRSDYSALPNGELVKLRKYAPMGSALCFPTLATCVWAIAVTAVASCCGSLETSLGSVYVYGDDLIVPASTASLVTQSLEKYGLLVNRDKSFIGGRFAESCGMDAFDGVCVTPIRLKTLASMYLEDKQGLVKAMVALTAHAGELQRGGLHTAAEYYYSLVETVLGPLPYATDTSPYLGRLTTAEAWPALQGEWLDRARKEGRSKSTRNFVAWQVKSETIVDEATDPWAHMYRTHTSWGSGEVIKWGTFEIPRKFRLQQRTFKGDTLACGVYPVPEWVKSLGIGSR